MYGELPTDDAADPGPPPPGYARRPPRQPVDDDDDAARNGLKPATLFDESKHTETGNSGSDPLLRDSISSTSSPPGVVAVEVGEGVTDVPATSADTDGTGCCCC